MKTRILSCVGLLVGFALLTPRFGYAWGDLAHEVICTIALQELTPPARAEVQRLVQQDPDPHYRRFATACTWADRPRQRANEHFLNVPRTQTTITEADATCGTAEACVVTAIAADTQILQDASAADAAKGEALKFLGHWLGDVHQPLHISFADDRGGNEIRTTGRCVTDLHAVWDMCLLLQGIGHNVSSIATALRAQLTEADRQAWIQGDAVSWANESYHVTRAPNVQYCVQVGPACQYAAHNATWAPGEAKRTVAITASYMTTQVPTVRSRLLKAGVRPFRGRVFERSGAGHKQRGVARPRALGILGYYDIFQRAGGSDVLPAGSVSMDGGGDQAPATLEQTASGGVRVVEWGDGVSPVVCVDGGEPVLGRGAGAQAQHGAPTIAGVVL